MKAVTDKIAGASLVNLLEITRGFPADESSNTAGLWSELWAYTLEEIGSGLTGTKCAKVASAGDAYQLLDDTEMPADVYAVALVTWGWAAPINPTTGHPDGVPSEHPERRRVRLICTQDDTGRGFSRLHFVDTGENVEDNGEARGPIADALADLLN